MDKIDLFSPCEHGQDYPANCSRCYPGPALPECMMPDGGQACVAHRRLVDAIERARQISGQKLDGPLSTDARNHWLSYRIAVDQIREWARLQSFV